MKHKVNYRRHKKNRQSDADWTRQKPPKNEAGERMVQRQRENFISLTADQVKRAEQLLIRLCQHDSFTGELINIARAIQGKLRRLSVSLSDGLIRINSRIATANDISEQQRCPSVFYSDHHIARLYIGDTHRRLAPV